MLNLQVKDAVPIRSYAVRMETMGERLRRLRESRGLTQLQFAKLVGVSKSAVSQWEDSSTQNIKLKVLANVLSVLHTDLKYLVWGQSRGPDGDPGARPLRRRGAGN